MIDYCDIGKPRHVINVIVWVLALMAVVFIIWKKQPVRVVLEDSNSIKLYEVERKK